MILHTGMRTDIPAFYSEWFENRIREGFVLVRNPYNPQRVTRYRITPELVDLIGFCTKNPAPMLPRMRCLSPFNQYWFVTVTCYGPEIEPHVPRKDQVLESVRRLSDIVGPECVGWRYDPVFLTEKYTISHHLSAFEHMASVLEGYTKTVVFSFLDLYEKTKKNFPEGRRVSWEDQVALARGFAEIGRTHGMTVKACAEDEGLKEYVNCDGCMTQEVYEKVLHSRIRIPGARAARPGCACYLGGDIGAYETCMHLCRYCYANWDARAVERNYRKHDVHSPLLTGHVLPTDLVSDAKQESWLDGQMRMELD